MLKYLLLFVVSLVYTQTVTFVPPQAISVVCNGVYQDSPNVCSGFGVCVSNGTCICEPGVTGTNCEIFSCFGVPSNSSTVCNGQGICEGPDLCSCFSGFNGTTCQNVVAFTCPFASVDQNSISNPPSLNPLYTYFQNDTLYVAIDSPIVAGRLETNISIQNTNLAACNYPGPYWNNVLINNFPCFNRFQAAIPWSIAKFCGWDILKNTNSSGQSQVVFSGKLIVSQREDLGLVGTREVYRVISNAIGITITFQTTIVLAVSVNVYTMSPLVSSTPILTPIITPLSLFDYPDKKQPVIYRKPFFAAITRQEYVAGPPRQAFFGLITKIGYPYLLTNPAFVALPVGLSSPGITEVTPSGECNPAADFCIQEWSIPINILSACTLTGIYRISFTKNCNTVSQQPCYPETIYVDLDVNSENFCAIVQLNVDLNATILSSGSPSFINGPVLASNRDGYFDIIVASAQAQIMDVIPQRIHLTTNRNTYVVVDQGNITPYGNSVGFTYLPPPARNQRPFKMILRRNDLGKYFTIGTVFDVKYGGMIRKLSINPLSTNTIMDEVTHVEKGEGKVTDRLEKQITLIDVNTNESNSISFGISIFTLLFIISLIL